MKRPVAPGLTVRKSDIAGLGCFATISFGRFYKIAEYTGERISQAEASRRILRRKIIRICGINRSWAIDGGVGGNGTHYINHSCRPNCFIRVAHGRVLILALRNIVPGEELTVDYGESYHNGSVRCRCGARGCRGVKVWLCRGV
jgi:uncharacterized protein